MIKVFIGILGKALKSSFWQYVILILKRDWIKFEIVLLSLSLGFSLEYQGHPNTKYQQIINIDHGVFHLGGGGVVLVIGIEDIFTMIKKTPSPTNIPSYQDIQKQHHHRPSRHYWGPWRSNCWQPLSVAAPSSAPHRAATRPRRRSRPPSGRWATARAAPTPAVQRRNRGSKWCNSRRKAVEF